MPKSIKPIIEQYESGKYQGYEIDVVIEIQHNEGEDNSPDWRTDNRLHLSAGTAWKVLEFLKTLDE